MGSHSVTCHPTEVILTPLPRHIAGTHLSTPEGWKAELTQVAGYTNMVYPPTVGHPSKYNRARRRVTNYVDRDQRATTKPGHHPNLIGVNHAGQGDASPSQFGARGRNTNTNRPPQNFDFNTE